MYIISHPLFSFWTWGMYKYPDRRIQPTQVKLVLPVLETREEVAYLDATYFMLNPQMVPAAKKFVKVSDFF